MPKSLTFLNTMNRGESHHWEFPSFTLTINVLNGAVLQEVLKIPGVELVDLHKIADRPPVVEAETAPTPKVKKNKPRSNPTPYHDRFQHPSGKPAHYFLTQYLAKHGQSGLAELKRHLKTEGFETGTAMGAMTKMVERGEAISKKPNGYVLTEAGKAKAQKELVG